MAFRSRSTTYPRVPYHVTRFCSSLSTIIVVAILIFFIYHLHQDSFRMPWAFLVLLITAFLTIISHAFTSCLNCCTGVSPILSLFFNLTLLVLWAASLGLLSKDISGTLTTTCDTSDWGTSTGIMVCRLYKVLFTFTVTAFVAQLFAVILDIVARRRQTTEYNRMVPDAALADITVAKRASTTSSTNTNNPTLDAYNAFGTNRPQQRFQGRLQPTTYTAPLEHHHAGEAQDYYEHASTRGGAMRPQQYAGYANYSPYKDYAQPPEQTHYDPGHYR